MTTQFYRIKRCGGAECRFLKEASNPNKQIIYHFVGNLSESPNPFELLVNVFIRDLPFDFREMVNL